jgi:hypothetical protein
MAKRQKELDEKERKERDEKERKERKEWDEKEAGYDGDSDGVSDGDNESEEEQNLPYETPAKMQSLVTFDTKDAMSKPIMYNKEKVLPKVAIEWLIEAIFELHPQEFEYTGVDIGILMGNTNAIVGDIEKYLVDCEHPLKEASEEDIRVFCGHIERVLDMLDGMFSILRKKHGQVGDVDYVAYEQSADQAMKIRKELGLSYTPSFH